METALTSSLSSRKEHDMFRAISLATVLTGTLDIIAAQIHFYFATGRGATIKLFGAEEPVSFFSYLEHGGMCKYISAAIFGDRANAGGTLMIIWGIVFHYMIAFLFTAFLFIIYTQLIKQLKKKFIVALFYGLFAWAMMNLIVIPLSKINKLPSDPVNMFVGQLIVIAMVAWPVATIAHRFYSRKELV